MPTTYAHWRFGDQVLQTLDEKLQQIIVKYRDLFDIGVHGPDIFFYYDCLKSNPVIAYGTWMHNTPMKAHMEMFKRNYLNSNNKDASLAYLLGFLAHFTLDSYCHGYIDHKKEEEGPSHARIEAQYDRHLLEADGYDPEKQSVTTSLHPSKFNARVIAQLFDDYNEEDILKTTKDQVFYLNLLKDSNPFKRWFLRTAMKAVKAYDYLDLLIDSYDDETCITSNMRLDKYTEKAVIHYKEIAENAIAYLNDEGELNDYFNNNFGPKPDYKSIPLLSVEDEKVYTVDFQK